VLERLAPDATAQDVTRIDIARLQARGIRAIILDLDNTLTAWNSLAVDDRIVAWVQSAQRAGLKLAIVSNSSKFARVRALSERLGVEAIAHPGAKPFGGGFERALRMLDTEASATAAAGDQLLTDILGAKRAGLYTILLTPLTDNEFIATKLTRIVERIVMRAMRKRGLLPEGDGEPCGSSSAPRVGEGPGVSSHD
jgi:HAD superfamily phosphatase (TIGR01668 family)